MKHSSAAQGKDIEVNAGNLGELAYQTIRRLILERQLPGGTAVIEGRLAKELNISRTPMREALVRLEGEGLLVRSGARSYSVRTVRTSEHFQSMQVREWLECKAIDLAIGKIPQSEIDDLRVKIDALKDTHHQEAVHWQVDDLMHMLCPRASGNQVLARLIAEARVANRLFEVMDPFGRVREDSEEHLIILDALEAGDAKAAKKALVKHFRNIENFVLQRVRGS
jgi:DNA-binding GntR family transcriptional regulator